MNRPAKPAPIRFLAAWKNGPHLLTYHQAGRTFGLVSDALEKDQPGGAPSDALTAICDDLLEASIPAEHKNTTTALAVDWSDLETFSRPPSKSSQDRADQKPPGDTARTICLAPKTSCSTGTTSQLPARPPKNTARRCLSWPAG